MTIVSFVECSLLVVKMASMAKQTTKSYHYSSSGGGRGDANVTIEYSADLSSLHRLEVTNTIKTTMEERE